MAISRFAQTSAPHNSLHVKFSLPRKNGDSSSASIGLSSFETEARDKDRLKAIKQARPDAHLIVDANEGWSIKALHDLAPFMHEYGVVLCEQPLPVTEDSELKGLRFPFRLCADESIHTSSDIPGLCDRYQVINIKLDKTGGLTEALETIKIARHHNLEIMVGCMLASSLALAPAALIASLADWIDLDGPLLLAQDYEPRLDYEGAQLLPPSPQLWG